MSEGLRGFLLLHEAFHVWGYYADAERMDWADNWAQVYQLRITQTRAWKKFMANPIYNNIRGLARLGQ